MDIKGIAQKLVKQYKTNNPFDLCDYLNIAVIINDLGEEVRGMYQYYNRKKLIYINTSLDRSDKKIVCSHELGHAVVHPKSNCIFLQHNTFLNTDRLEIEANIFATELLISDENIKSYFGTGYTISQIASELKVHDLLVEYKVKNLI